MFPYTTLERCERAAHTMLVWVFTVAVACWSTSQPFPYGTSSKLIDQSSGWAQTTSHTTHWESEVTTPRVTSRTYMLLGEQGLEREGGGRLKTVT